MSVILENALTVFGLLASLLLGIGFIFVPIYAILRLYIYFYEKKSQDMQQIENLIRVNQLERDTRKQWKEYKERHLKDR